MNAVIVPLPEAAPAVDAWREQTCQGKPSTGVPPHVTLLAPFAPVSGAVLRELAEVFAEATAFAVELRELRRFPGTLYLAPDPAAPFAALTEALIRRFPGYPPYGDPSLPIVPHLTVAQGDAELLDQVEAELTSSLPIAAEACGAVLLEQERGAWRVRDRFRFR